jgi:hypothetical protein
MGMKHISALTEAFARAHLPSKPAASLRSRIRGFFEANPGELLTFADIAAKFDCTEQQAKDCVKGLIRAGVPLATTFVVGAKPESLA